MTQPKTPKTPKMTLADAAMEFKLSEETLELFALGMLMADLIAASEGTETPLALVEVPLPPDLALTMAILSSTDPGPKCALRMGDAFVIIGAAPGNEGPRMLPVAMDGTPILGPEREAILDRVEAMALKVLQGLEKREADPIPAA